MSIDEIIKAYGMVDYTDVERGCIYQLSIAEYISDGTLAVPMVDNLTYEFIGYILVEVNE